MPYFPRRYVAFTAAFCWPLAFIVPFFLVPHIIDPRLGWLLYLSYCAGFMEIILWCLAGQPTFLGLRAWIPFIGVALIVVILASPVYSHGPIKWGTCGFLVSMEVAVTPIVCQRFLWREARKQTTHVTLSD